VKSHGLCRGKPLILRNSENSNFNRNFGSTSRFGGKERGIVRRGVAKRRWGNVGKLPHVQLSGKKL